MKNELANDDAERILEERIEKIQQIVLGYGEENFYISFSGGKDSCVVSALLDEAVPDNQIPRVFFNTGIEYNAIVKFVKDLAANDSRFEIVRPAEDKRKGFLTDEDIRNGYRPVNIPKMLEEVGYPFKSKEYSKILENWRRGNRTSNWMRNYLGGFEGREWSKFTCPVSLRYQFTDEYTENGLKISSKCCDMLKKKPAKAYNKARGKTWVITGMMREEGGHRTSIHSCVSLKSSDGTNHFSPLIPVSAEWEDWYIERCGIRLCELYYPPYNFKRTGCKGCPYSLELQANLDTLAKYLPSERAQCERIWKPVYDEYRRIGYRLTNQVTMSEYMMQKGKDHDLS